MGYEILYVLAGLILFAVSAKFAIEYVGHEHKRYKEWWLGLVALGLFLGIGLVVIFGTPLLSGPGSAAQNVEQKSEPSTTPPRAE